MKNNQGILNLTEKKIYFKFKDEDFVMDLTEGDLHDSWNSFNTSDGVVRDLDFYWEGYSAGSTPTLTVYGLTKDEGDNDYWSTNTDDETNIKLIKVIGTEGEYFDIPFDGVKKDYFEVLDADGKVFLKTKRFNKGSDIATMNKMDFVCIDVYGNRKLLNPKNDLIKL